MARIKMKMSDGGSDPGGGSGSASIPKHKKKVREGRRDCPQRSRGTRERKRFWDGVPKFLLQVPEWQSSIFRVFHFRPILLGLRRASPFLRIYFLGAINRDQARLPFGGDLRPA